MGFDPLSMAIGGAVIGGGLSAAGASSQNDALSQQAGNAGDAATIQAQQLADQRSLEIEKQRREAAAIRGRLRVSAAEAGTGYGGSAAALDQSAALDAATNQAIIERNYQTGLASIATGLAAQRTQIASNMVNPALAAFSGGLSGASTGLSVYSGLNAYRNMPKPRLPMPDSGPLPTIPGTGLVDWNATWRASI